MFSRLFSHPMLTDLSGVRTVAPILVLNGTIFLRKGLLLLGNDSEMFADWA